jgi:hypothetical protein
MKTIKLSHVLFSFAVIAALMLAAVPMAPAHAMTTSTAQVATIGAHSPVVTSGAVICRSITVWRHGHRITLRVCHRVHPHSGR